MTKINTQKDILELDQITFDAMVNSGTINLGKRKTTRQMRIDRANKHSTLKFIGGMIMFTIIFVGALSNWNYVEAVEKPSGNLCQNLAFTDSERFERECDTKKVIETITAVKKGTYEEVIEYKDVEEKAFDFIVQFEGYHDKPYWDFKQYSCGYGMRCSKDTTGITKEKSKFFVIERIKSIREKHSLYQYDDSMEVALISFIYNIGSAPAGMKWYIDNGYINALKNMMKRYTYAGDKRLGGLVKRRAAEIGLF